MGYFDPKSPLSPPDGELSVHHDKLGAHVRKFDECAGSNGKWYDEAFIPTCFLPAVYDDQVVFDMVVNMTSAQKEGSMSIRHKLQYPVMYIDAKLRKKLKS